MAIPRSSIAVVGDMENDLAMFRISRYRFIPSSKRFPGASLAEISF
jgi:hypothetical protein